MPEFWFSKFVLEIGVFLRRRVAFDKNSYHQLERESTLRPVGHWTGSGSLSHAAWGDYSTKVKLRVDWILHHHPTTTTTLVWFVCRGHIPDVLKLHKGYDSIQITWIFNLDHHLNQPSISKFSSLREISFFGGFLLYYNMPYLFSSTLFLSRLFNSLDLTWYCFLNSFYVSKISDPKESSWFVPEGSMLELINWNPS